jgi:diguanylate cyclase (GGDEF)-like protein
MAEFSATRREGSRVGVMMVDLDNFKQANDSASHAYGDAILQIAAWRMDKFRKEIDSPKEMKLLVGRWGGEEFILAGVFRDETSAQRVAESFCQIFSEPSLPQDPEIAQAANLTTELTLPYPTLSAPITGSIGWAWMESAATADDLHRVVDDAIGRADSAMLTAKAIGKNRALAFTDILKRHGRVLEHRTDSGVVLIDIGWFVGVGRQTVFEVMPNDFASGAEYT